MKINKKKIYPISLIVLSIMILSFIISQNVVQADVVANPNFKDQDFSEILGLKIEHILASNIKTAKNEYSQVFDIKSDYSFQKYVSDNDLLQNKEYEPSDLVLITGGHIVIDTQKPYLRQAAATALKYMSEQFYYDMGHDLYLLSAYRSYKDQENLWENGCSTIRCAKIGGSEHQLGLAVDIHVATKGGYMQFYSGYLDWMNENAYKYGFINTYSKGPKVDGKMAEIRHWRFVGIPFATQLHQKDITFAERIKNIEQ